MTTTPHSGALGATVTGLDLARLSSVDLKTLRAALTKYLVVKVPGQTLDRFQLSALGAHFGPHFVHPIVKNGYADCPEVLALTREPEHTTSFGGESWHADITWMKPAGYISILHALEVPATGGDTAFSSTIAAFSQLSVGLKSLLRNLSAVHADHWYERREESPWIAQHPVVRRHPDDGREGLYVNRMFTSRFTQMSETDSAPLLRYLFNKLEQHEVTCRFQWNAGDVVLWDNRFTLHFPVNDFSGQRRHMIRTSVMEQ